MSSDPIPTGDSGANRAGAIDERRPVVRIILGPTGAGKTELAASLDPDRYEIISCDSRQVYREMPIGSAMPEPEVLARIRHHLVDFLAPTEKINAGTFARLAREKVHEVYGRGLKPVLVGGAGFYFRALKTGLFDAAGQADPATREKVRAMTHPERLAMLREGDPDAVLPDGRPTIPGFIHPHDAYRVERALEILLSTGTPWSEHWRRARESPVLSEFDFVGFYIEIEREQYWRRLHERAQAMCAAGLLEEAAALRKRYGDCPGLRTLGYAHALRALDGQLPLSELPGELAIAHRQYGKRQRTWFKRETELVPASLAELRKKVANGGFPDEFLGISEN